MRENSISQLPVIENGLPVGSLNEVTMIKLLFDGVDLYNTKVSDIMALPLPSIEKTVDISEVYRLLLAGHGGVIVTEK